jgi:hypothetical protein
MRILDETMSNSSKNIKDNQDTEKLPSHKRYFCLVCKMEVLICLKCDFGNIYGSSCKIISKLKRYKRAKKKYCTTSHLSKMLDTYGKELLTEAFQEVVIQECLRLKNQHFSLNRLESQSSQKNIPNIEINSEKFSKLVVKHHEPSHYVNIAGIKKC